MCRFEMAEGQAPTLAPKKLNQWFNSARTPQWRFKMHARVIHRIIPRGLRSGHYVLSRILMYCVKKICSFYSFVSWGDNSYQLRNLEDTGEIFDLFATYVTKGIYYTHHSIPYLIHLPWNLLFFFVQLVPSSGAPLHTILTMQHVQTGLPLSTACIVPVACFV